MKVIAQDQKIACALQIVRTLFILITLQEYTSIFKEEKRKCHKS